MIFMANVVTSRLNRTLNANKNFVIICKIFFNYLCCIAFDIIGSNQNPNIMGGGGGGEVGGDATPYNTIMKHGTLPTK